jgi:hypothetical protein
MKMDPGRVRFLVLVAIAVLIAELLIGVGVFPRGWGWLHWLDWIR